MAMVLFVGLMGCDNPPPPPEVEPARVSLPATADAVELTLPGQLQPYHGVVAAAQPTAEQFGQLKAGGYSAVVNLKTADEPDYRDEKEPATRQMLLYSHIPIAGPEDLTRANVERLAQTMSQPMALSGKLLIYAGDDLDRVGAMLALKAGWIDGRSAEDALEIGKRAGLLGLEAEVKERLQAN